MKDISKTFVFSVVITLFLTANIFAQKTDKKSQRVIQIDEIKIKELLKPNGKPLLVNFWATWCVPCREEFPELVEIDKKYKGKIDFITISLDDLAEINRDVPKFLKQMKAKMPAYLLRTNDENAVISSISKDWQGGLPFTILYAENGDVAHTKQGIIKPQIVKGKIDSLLKNESRIANSSKRTSKYTYENGMKDAKEDIAKGFFVIKLYGEKVLADYFREILKDFVNNHNVKIDNYGCVGPPTEYIKGYNKVSKQEITQRFGKIPVKLP